jgi:Rod binding domain-containing protein
MSIDIQSIGRSIQVAEKSEAELGKLKKATDGFEAIFLKKLFSQMRSSVKETQFGQTFGKEIYNDMFDEAMANAAAKSKSLGLGDMLYEQFAPRIRQQIARSQGRPPSLPVEKLTSNDPEGRDSHRQDVDATTKKDLKTESHGLKGRITHPEDRDARTAPRKS